MNIQKFTQKSLEAIQNAQSTSIGKPKCASRARTLYAISFIRTGR